MAKPGIRDRFRRRRLSVRLVVVILLVSSVITLAVTGWQLLVDYRRDLTLLEQRIDNAHNSFARSLGASLWSLDQDQLRLQLRGLLEVPHVHEVEIDGDLPMRVGEATRYSHRRSFQYPISHRTPDGRHHQLGELTIRVSLEQIHSRLLDRIKLIIGTQAIKTFLVSSILLAVFYRLVTRHLQTLAQFASKLRLHQLDRRVALHRRRPTGWLRPDELDELSAALNFASERIRNDLMLREGVERQRKLMAEALEQCPSGIVLMNAEGRIAYVNPRFETITGDPADALRGRHLFGRADSMESRLQVLHGNSDPWLQLQETGEWHGDIRLRRTDGHFRWAHLSLRRIANRDAEQCIALFEDMTRLHQTQAQLDVSTYFHHLTELPNRLAMFEKLAELVRKEHSDPVAVVFLDIDNFKLINDSLGHEAGDAVIRDMAKRISRMLPDHWQLGHFGGDEFIILASGSAGDSATRDELATILKRLREPMRHADRDLFISASAGMAVYPAAGSTAADLFRAADAALHSAKHDNRGSLRVFEPSLSQRSFQRLTMESDLRRGLAEGQLVNYYQPVIDSGSESPSAIEALVRWQHPDLGLLSPGSFIAMAEETGLIVPLGEWVLRRGLQDLAALRQACACSTLKLSVNVSAQQIMEPGFIDLVRGALADCGLEPEVLQIEITEEAFLQDIAVSRDTLNGLHDMGVTLAVDDFGTGYSALSYFKRMPIDYLKIDQSFVHDMFLRDRDLQLVGAVVSLAHGLGLKVVAEGVETEAQRAHLELIGCEFLQGYLLARPMPLAQLQTFLEEARSDA